MAQDIAGRTGRPTRVGELNASLLDTAPYRIGSVTLAARDLNGLAHFYRAVVGLTTVSQEADVIRLGVGATVLLELRHDPAARPWRPQEAGLFHTAFLLPSRGDLGAWLAHAAGSGIRLTGAADHLVSEAVYLTDPEGNGIEIYVDRPFSEWPRADDGSIAMSNDPLDHDGLVRVAPGPWTGMPPAGRVGHVHLQVGALDPAARFYSVLLGFDVTCRYPSAVFFGAGGYHHQLAANTWNSRGAPVRSTGTTGLAGVALLASPEALDAARTRCRQAGLPFDEADGSLVLHDPWGTRLRLIPLSDSSPPASRGDLQMDGTEASDRLASKVPVLG